MDKKLIVARIEQLMDEKGITKYQLKEAADISTTIYQWKKNAARDKDRVPSLRSIEKVCEYLGVSLSYFFAFDEEGETSVRERELVRSMRGLSKEQVLLLERIVKEFRK